MNRRLLLAAGAAVAVMCAPSASAQLEYPSAEERIDGISLVPPSPTGPEDLSREELEAIVAECDGGAEVPAALRIFDRWAGISGSRERVTPTAAPSEESFRLRFGSARGRYAVLVFEAEEGGARILAEVIDYHAAHACYHRWRLLPGGEVLRMLGGEPDRETSPARILWTGEVFRDDKPVEGLVVSGFESISSADPGHRFSTFRATLEIATFDRLNRRRVALERVTGIVPPPEPPMPGGPPGERPERPLLAKMLSNLFGGKETEEDGEPKEKEPAEYVFDELNFRFVHPGQGFFRPGTEKLNPAASLVLAGGTPPIYLTIIAEEIGLLVNVDNEGLVELVKTSLRASGVKAEFGAATPHEVNGISFLSFPATIALNARSEIPYQYLVASHHGYLYQLIFWSGGVTPKSLLESAGKLSANFHLIDPDRIAGGGENKAPPYRSEDFGITADWGEQGGIAWPDMETIVPGARSGAVLGPGGSAALILPLDLGGLDPDFDSLAQGLLATVNVDYPTEVRSSVPHIQGTASGREIIVHQLDNGSTYDYRLRVLRNGDTACLLGGWIANGGPPGTEKLVAMLDAVTFSAPAPRGERAAQEPRYRAPDGDILNVIGLSRHAAGDYEAAAGFFRAAFEAQPRNAVYLTNVLEALEQSGLGAQALDFLRDHLDGFSENRAVLAREASLLHRNERHVEAAEKYAVLFDGGFEDDDSLLDYLGLLTGDGHYDRAIEAVARYLDQRGKPSLRARRWQGQVFSHAGKTDEAVAIFAKLVDENPDNPQFADDLVEALVDGERPAEALEKIDARLATGDDGAPLRVLRGRANFLLKNHRHAKEDFEKALALSPGDPEIGEWIDHASAALGQGDNTAIKTPIEPVAMPPALAELTAAPEAVDADSGSGYGVRILENVTGFHFEKDTPRRRTDYRAVRIQNRAGIENYSTLQFGFDPLYENIFANRVEVFDEKGMRVAQGNPADYYVSGGNSSQIATTERVLYIPVPGLRVGHTLKFAVTREDKAPSGDFAYESFILASDSPSTSRAVFVTGDIAAVRARADGDGIARTTAEGAVFWRISPVPLYQSEAFQPKLHTFLPRIALGSDRRDWRTIGSEYLDEIADRLAPSDSTRALAARITEGLEGDQARADALIAWVQKEITYQAIEFGSRARIPNPPERIVENRYGDCKDQSVLLHDLLRAAGIASNLVLINGSSVLDEELPSLDQFNHMIVRAPSLVGGFIDCTSKFQSPRLAAPEGLAGTRALVLDPAGPALDSLPPAESVANTLDCVRELSVADGASGDLLVRETLSASGYCAGWLRGYFHNGNAADYQRNLQRILGDLAKFELEEVTLENLDAHGDPFVMRLRYRIRKATRLAGDEGTLLPPAVWEDYYFKPTFTTERKHPFAIEQPFLFTSEARFSGEGPWLPAPVPDQAPDAGGEAPGFLWTSTRENTPQGWRQTARLAMRAGDFPREAFHDYQRALDDALDNLKLPVPLTPGTP